jgi:hypothetical protein
VRGSRRVLWALAALAAASAAALYALWIRPMERAIADVRAQAAAARAEEASLRARVARDKELLSIPLPLPAGAVNSAWPRAVSLLQAAGFDVDTVSISDAAPLSAPGPQGAPPGAPLSQVAITARIGGPYLGIDAAVASVQQAIPLWAWRSVSVTASQKGSAHEVSVSFEGVVPFVGAAPGPARPLLAPQPPGPPSPPAGPGPAQPAPRMVP